jgi:hypothetical protein
MFDKSETKDEIKDIKEQDKDSKDEIKSQRIKDKELELEHQKQIV